MSIAKLRLDESTKLEFGVQITGASGLPQSRLVIEGKEYSIAYPCKPTTEGVEVQINELKNVFPAGTYPVRLEVIIENKIYTPFQDTITFEPAVEVATKPKATPVQVKETIKVDKVVVRESTVNQDRMMLASAIAELVGYYPKLDESAQTIVDRSLERQVTGKAKASLDELLNLAEQVGINVNRD